MALITASMLDLTTVTPELIGRAHKCFDAAGKPFYMVESSRDLFDGDGNRVEYKVTWSKEKGFQCTCESGQEGFRGCGMKKVCDHVLAAVAAAKEEREAMKALNEKSAPKSAAPAKREHYIEANGCEISETQYKRILNSKGQDTSARVNRANTKSSQGFSLMR